MPSDYSPTIIAASLNDKELQESIKSLVSTVKTKTETMAGYMDTAVERMKASLKSLGNISVDMGGSADGGSSRRAKKQVEEKQAVDGTKMSYDNLVGALQMAEREVRKWEGHKTFSTEDLNKYQAALARVVELDEKLKQAKGNEVYKQFEELSRRTAFDAKSNVGSLFATDARLTQLNKFYSKLESEDQKRIAREERDSQKRIALTEKERAAREKMIQAQRKEEEKYQNSILRSELGKTLKQPAQSFDEIQGKLERLKTLLANIRDLGFLTPKEITSAETEITKLTQKVEQFREALQRVRENEQRQKALDATVTRQQTATVGVSGESLGWGDVNQQAINSRRILAAEQIAQATRKEKEEYSNLELTIASLIGVKASELNITSSLDSTYSALSSSLRKMSSAYDEMNKKERDSAKGQELANAIQETSKAINDIQKQKMRPISLDKIIDFKPQTLDDIAYKIQKLQMYRSGIDITKQGASREIDLVNKAIAELIKKQRELLGTNKSLFESNNALSRSWNYMKNRLAFYFTVGASTAFVKNLIEVRSQYEMNERALGILINSAERGTQIFNELSQMALVSPYTLIELSSAAKQLTAYDVAAKDVVDTTRRLADMAAAVGIPIERLTYALGQIKAYGYLNSRDARMFANAGIPLVKQLSDYYTELEGKLVSTGDVYDRIKKKAIDYNDVMQVINKMTDEGGKFFDFQAKMAGTLKVQLANLTLAWNNMLNEIGASEQGVISTGIGLLKNLFLEWKNISKMLTNLAIGFGVVKAAQLAYYGVVRGTNKAIALETVLGNRLSKSLRSLSSSMNAASMASTTLWVAIATLAAAAVVDILRGNEAMKEFNKTIRENAQNTYNDLEKFSDNYRELRESLYKTENGKQTPVDINSEEAKKAWEVLREQIELSSHASDEYISKLLSIENVSERLRQGFAIIESIQSVSAAIKELGDDAIKLERNWSKWWNLGLLPDGTIENLQDTHKWLSKIEERYGSILTAREAASGELEGEDPNGLHEKAKQDEARAWLKRYERELENFRKDLQTTTLSIIDFIELKGWSGDVSKINEAFKTFEDNMISKFQLNPQQAYLLQLEMEEARSKAAKQALLQRILDEQAALNKSYDEDVAESSKKDIDEYKHWEDFNGRKKVEWERFTKWLKEQHISETTAMFRDMDEEDIKSLNFQEGKHAEWVTRMVTKYAKEHKMSYDEAFGYLKSWVTSAKQWSIFIPLFIGTKDKKSVYEQLGEYDKAVDEADAQIERLTKRINELNAKKKKSKEETQELADAEQELADAQKAKADAEAKGGHGKKDKKDANKEQKQAEKELAKALNEELSLIDKVRSNYKKLTKEGVDAATALSTATSGFDETVERINAVLGKYGIGKLDLTKYAGASNPKAIMEMLQAQLDALSRSGLAKISEIKDIQVKLQDLKVESLTFDQQTLTQSLNSELSKLKDEYELAVELDANPELGGVFADMMGLSKEELEKLPRDFEGVVRRLQSIVDKQLGMGAFDVRSNLNKDVFDKWVKSSNLAQDGEKVKALKAITDYANKVRLDETKKQIDDWNKLLEKYAEYEYKRTQITQEAERERELARKKGAPSHVMTAIDIKEAKDLAKVNIEEFQQSSEWITATGDLVGLTEEALGLLIKRIEEFKKSQKYLDAKQIKQLNNALKQLYQQQRKGNPFLQLSNAIRENKMRREEWSKELEEDGKIIEEQNKRIEEGTHLTEEETKTRLYLIGRIKELKEGLATLKDVTPEQVIDYLQTIYSVASQAAGAVSDMMKAFGNTEDAETINKVMSTLEKGLQFAQMGSAIGGKSAGGWGAAIGGAIGLLVGSLTSFADEISGNASITDEIQKSERAVKRLSNAYEELSWKAEKAYGAIVSGTEQATVENKKLQLAEMERQLELEKSRSKKRYDEERVIELEGEVENLRREIKDATSDIVNELLGISSAGDEITNLVQVMIDAFRNGEDAMEAFGKEWDKMIDNMILKLLVSEYMKRSWDNIMKTIEKKQQEFLEKGNANKAAADAEIERLKTANAYDLAKEYVMQHYKETGDMYGLSKYFLLTNNYNRDELARAAGFANAEALRQYLIQQQQEIIAGADAQLERASQDYTEWTLDYMMNEGRDIMMSAAEGLKQGIDEYYDFGELAEEQKLSNLQQGIQSLSEDTGNAIESYLNGISQQIYLHSSQLEEIKTLMQGWDFDVSLGTMSQVLLQLQSSYQVQMTIQNTLLGWSSPNGMSVRVEMV